MISIEEQLLKAKTEERNFQLNSSINKRRSKNIDKLKVYDKYIYAYILENAITVYDINTFKEIANLKIPFKRGEQNPFKEYIFVDILENGIALILAYKHLYFYEINLKESQLKFLKYISEVYHFCILEKKKEIFLLTENTLVGDYYGMAKCDFSGNITFRNKKDKPKIYSKYIEPKDVNGDTLFFQSTSRAPIHFDSFDSFNNEKFIINVWGYNDNWYHYSMGAPKDEKYNISVYDSENLKQLFKEEYEEDLRYVKINDNYFKKCRDDYKIFYYDEKSNKIIFMDNITNIIYKKFNVVYKNINENMVYFVGEEKEPDEKYFNLKNDKFCFFDGTFLFIIDLSKDFAIKKIDMKIKDYLVINDICLLEKNGSQYLYISMFDKDNKIIKGYIL
jgi:hypothetical protein